jgi:hypothetical protein
MREFHCHEGEKTKVYSQSATYYECGCCEMFHAAEWNGDCRQDNARLTLDELDAKHPDGYMVINLVEDEL